MLQGLRLDAVTGTLAHGLHLVALRERWEHLCFPLCLAAGEYNLRLGITKELHPDMVSTHQGEACLEFSSCWVSDVVAALVSQPHMPKALAADGLQVRLALPAMSAQSTCAGEPRVLDGHAFVVEAAVSVGGRDIKPGINIYRFANRIPLLFEVSAPSKHLQAWPVLLCIARALL